MRVPLLDLDVQHSRLRPELEAAFARVLLSSTFILGPEVDALEKEMASLFGARHAIGVSSGTDALLATLMALGVGQGDEVLTTPYSFFATVGCIVRLGARPILCDIEPRTFNLDIEKAVARLSSRTRAIIPVHLFGRMARTERLAELVPDTPCIEDAAQSIGARRHGRASGSAGIAGCLSFFPAKNLGALGDGGLVLTSDDALSTRVRSLRTHGSSPGRKYHHDFVGGNFRLDELQAALLRVKLPHLEEWSEARRRNAARYRSLLHGLPLELPPEDGPEEHSVYNQFVIRAPRRDALRSHLAEREIQTAIYYPRPLHLQPCFAFLGHHEGDFPVAEEASRVSLALPIYPDLTDAQQGFVAEQIRSFYEH
jgi:dTDP-4-amino-4,6-dideoxygalactose transaminase